MIIIDMEMPRWCGECKMCKEETINGDTYTYCELLNQDITWNGNRVDDCPLRKVEERPIGHWIPKPFGDMCSNCRKEIEGFNEYLHYDYCPYCDAKMEGYNEND